MVLLVLFDPLFVNGLSNYAMTNSKMFNRDCFLREDLRKFTLQR